MSIAANFLRGLGYRVELLIATLLRLGSIVERRVLIANQMVSLGLHMTHVVLFVGLFMGMIVSPLRILQLCSAQCHQWFP